jgi:RNA methyltransferase, TrmH family
VAEGEDLVGAALEGGWELDFALVDAARPPELPLRAEQAASHLLAEVSTLGHAPRVIGVFGAARAERALPPVGLELWRVGDPGNVGTLARACDAFGAYLALSPGCADPFGPKALRASTGSIFRVPMADFAPQGAVALVAHDAPPLTELDPSLSRFVLGSEREGLPDEVVAACAASATIPLAGPAESLNVAMAGTIALYDWRRSHGAR